MAEAAASGRRAALLRIARDPGTRPEVLDGVAREAGADAEILLAVAANPAATEGTLAHVAAAGPPAVQEALAAQPERLRAHPEVVRSLLANPRADEALRARVRPLLSAAPQPPAEAPADREACLRIARDPGADPAALDGVAREAGADEEVLLALACHPRTPEKALLYIALAGSAEVLRALAAQGERLAKEHPAVARAMLENPEADDALRAALRALLLQHSPDAARHNVPLYNLIKGMSTGQRLALAVKGTKEARMILVKDANEMVALEVVRSPRITETEVLSIAQMRDVNENVLRSIAVNKQHRANKQITWALLNNPKTPTGIALGLGLGSLSEKELDSLVKNKNISATLQRAARSALEKKRKPPTLPGQGH